MRAFAIILMVLVAGAIGFFAGRASGPDIAPAVAYPTQAIDSNFPASFPASAPVAAQQAVPTDYRAGLLLALQQPQAQRSRAVRRAMSAWLAADGAAALAAVRVDPELRDLAERMMQLALYAYPEVFLDDPSLLEGIPNAEQLIATAAHAIAAFDPEIARALVEEHLSGTIYGEAMLSAVGVVGQPGSEPLPVDEAHAELETILAERNLNKRLAGLMQLINRVAANDPAAAAELIGSLPGPSTIPAIGMLTRIWSEQDPESAARWLANQSARDSEIALNLAAQTWGNRDFEAANAFLDTLTGAQRRGFLTGLANATGHMSNTEMLSWMSRHEDDPAYSQLVTTVAHRLARDDAPAAMALIENLPEEAQLASYSSVLPMLAMQDPQAAIAMIDGLDSESAREQLAPLAVSFWAQDDARSALDWALDLQSGPARDQTMASIAYSQMSYDLDRAIEAIEEIEDRNVRRSTARRLLVAVESEDEAIRLGRDYNFDRDAVLELRASESIALSPFMFPQGSTAFFFNEGIIGGIRNEAE